MEEKEKDITKNKAHIVEDALDTLNLNISYQTKEKQRKKQQKNINDIMMMKMML